MAVLNRLAMIYIHFFTLMYCSSSSSKGILCSLVYGSMLFSTVAAISSGAATLSSMKNATLWMLRFEINLREIKILTIQGLTISKTITITKTVTTLIKLNTYWC